MSDLVVKDDHPSALAEVIHPVAHYIEQARRANTRQAYRQGLERFASLGYSLPASPGQVCEFLVKSVYRGDGTPHSLSTLRLWLAAINFAHKRAGYASPTGHILVLQTIEGIEQEHGRLPRQVRPLVKADVAAMIQVIRADKSETRASRMANARDQSAILLGFSAALRRSELVGLEFSDLEFQQGGVVITLRVSKTRRKTEGHKVGVPCASAGTMCPVKSLRHWLDLAGISDGKIFRRLHRGGKVGSRGMSTHALAELLKYRAGQAGIPPADVSGHSLRAGFVTSAIDAGQPERLIQQQGGWVSPAMLSVYYRNSRLFDLNMW